ncbi:hypothetical protein BDV23DRAFT_71727 [Aspergillus alliaceus]|uniref:Uncharacterized protein n=1 Tax=Petromyces alliaceus TaxID=209559 RepID=A0A5N7CB40_PETAA|nr:hypothetical protein BDV23DRAFT_71727 [Aspergillus alliaceus]
MNSTNKNSNSYPISSDSRSKLNAFQYIRDETSIEKSKKSPTKSPLQSAHTNKENQYSWLNGVARTEQPELSRVEPSGDISDSKAAKECPQTPGNRIPLADLISNAEDAISQAPGQVFTPEDYVTWQHVPVSSNPDTMSQTPATQDRKRRHISTPTSSPLAENSKGAHKGSYDMQSSLQGLLKTPQTDLATELWNNYVGKITANNNGTLPQPRFTYLLSSSPQTPAPARTGRDSSGLRRSNSCNAEWPSSEAKRRKVEGKKTDAGRSIFSRTKSNVVDSGGINSSKINFLMEKIEKSLRNAPKSPKPRVPASDSSPVPRRRGVQQRRSASPIQDRPYRHASLEANQGNKADEISPESQGQKQNSSSEFGDDDFDEDFLELAEASMDPDPFVEHDREPGAVDARRNIALFPTDTHNPFQEKQKPYIDVATSKLEAAANNKSSYTLDAAEFDDDEFDEFSDNIDDILAECDAAPSTKVVRPVSQNILAFNVSGSGSGAASPSMAAMKPAQVSRPQGESSSDEFDDDEFDMEAIEQTMTQTGADGSNYVCHS